MKTDKILLVILFVVLFGLSFLKDNFSPDYLNSRPAVFLDPVFHLSRWATLNTQSLFWFAAILYSIIFVILPTLIIEIYFTNPAITKFTYYLLTIICLSIYILIFINSDTLDHALIPKVNRYFHSPILTMFFIAAFSLIGKNK